MSFSSGEYLLEHIFEHHAQRQNRQHSGEDEHAPAQARSNWVLGWPVLAAGLSGFDVADQLDVSPVTRKGNGDNLAMTVASNVTVSQSLIAKPAQQRQVSPCSRSRDHLAHAGLIVAPKTKGGADPLSQRLLRKERELASVRPLGRRRGRCGRFGCWAC